MGWGWPVGGVQTSLLTRSFCPATRLQICADPLTRPVRILRELTAATVDDCLYFFLWLFRDWYMAVEVLVDEQANKHIKRLEPFRIACVILQVFVIFLLIVP